MGISNTNLYVIDDKGNPSKAVKEDGTETSIVSVNKLVFDVTSRVIETGKTFTITPTFDPIDAANKNLTWESDNTAVASVTDGVVTAKAAGTAIIKATADNGKYATCTVTVTAKKTAVTGVSISPKTITLYVDETSKLTATVAPIDADNKKVSWSSSDPTVVAVDNSGNIEGKKEGTANVTVTTDDGGKKDKCIVIVKKTAASRDTRYTRKVVNNTEFKDDEIGFDVTNPTSDLILHISPSKGTTINTLISGDSSQKHNASAFYEITLKDGSGNDVTSGFGICYVYIPLKSDMNTGNGKIWAVSVSSGALDTTTTCTTTTYNGSKCARIGTTHFSEFGILYKKNSSSSGSGSTITVTTTTSSSSSSSSTSSGSSSSSSTASTSDLLTLTTSSYSNSPAYSARDSKANTGSSRTLDSVPKTGDREWE